MKPWRGWLMVFLLWSGSAVAMSQCEVTLVESQDLVWNRAQSSVERVQNINDLVRDHPIFLTEHFAQTVIAVLAEHGYSPLKYASLSQAQRATAQTPLAQAVWRRLQGIFVEGAQLRDLGDHQVRRIREVLEQVERSPKRRDEAVKMIEELLPTTSMWGRAVYHSGLILRALKRAVVAVDRFALRDVDLRLRLQMYWLILMGGNIGISLVYYPEVLGESILASFFAGPLILLGVARAYYGVQRWSQRWSFKRLLRRHRGVREQWQRYLDRHQISGLPVPALDSSSSVSPQRPSRSSNPLSNSLSNPLAGLDQLIPFSEIESLRPGPLHAESQVRRFGDGLNRISFRLTAQINRLFLAERARDVIDEQIAQAVQQLKILKRQKQDGSTTREKMADFERRLQGFLSQRVEQLQQRLSFMQELNRRGQRVVAKYDELIRAVEEASERPVEGAGGENWAAARSQKSLELNLLQQGLSTTEATLQTFSEQLSVKIHLYLQALDQLQRGRFQQREIEALEEVIADAREI